MRKIYSAIVLSAAIAMTMSGCATYDRDNNRDNNGVRTNQYRYNANNFNPNGFTRNGMNNLATDNIRNNGLNQYNNNYGTNRTYSGNGPFTGMRDLGVNDNDMRNGNGNRNAYDKTVSKKIAKHVSAIKGVNSATVVVYGKDAIIGLDVNDNGNGNGHGHAMGNGNGSTNTSNLVNKVKRSVQDAHPGYNVYVTSDRNLNTRIRGLNPDMTPDGNGNGMAPLNGRPVRNFADDVADLINDIGRTVTEPFR